MTDGRLRPELQNEDLDDLRMVLGDRVRRDTKMRDGTRSLVDGIFPRDQEVFRPWVDLSYGKPATQSSHSPMVQWCPLLMRTRRWLTATHSPAITLFIRWGKNNRGGRSTF